MVEGGQSYYVVEGGQSYYVIEGGQSYYVIEGGQSYYVVEGDQYDIILKFSLKSCFGRLPKLNRKTAPK